MDINGINNQQPVAKIRSIDSPTVYQINRTCGTSIRMPWFLINAKLNDPKKNPLNFHLSTEILQIRKNNSTISHHTLVEQNPVASF